MELFTGLVFTIWAKPAYINAYKSLPLILVEASTLVPLFKFDKLRSKLNIFCFIHLFQALMIGSLEKRLARGEKMNNWGDNLSYIMVALFAYRSIWRHFIRLKYFRSSDSGWCIAKARRSQKLKNWSGVTTIIWATNGGVVDGFFLITPI